MSKFHKLLQQDTEALKDTLKAFEHTEKTKKTDHRIRTIATVLKIRTGQFVCGLSFNPNINQIPEVVEVLALDDISALHDRADEIYVNDIYQKLSLLNIMSIYETVKCNQKILQRVLELLPQRIKQIESRAEETVNFSTIKKYKEEMRAIYYDGVADMKFAEKRLQVKNSGFSAMVNEVSMIIVNKLIPAGDIFYRDNILPEEKLRLLDKGLIPAELARQRIQEKNLSPDEKNLLSEWLNNQSSQNN